MKKGLDLLRDPFLNKGTAFTLKEREDYDLEGLLPPEVETIEEQAQRTYMEYKDKISDVEKRHYLMDIFDSNRTLFYYLFSKHLVEFMPIVYDPTVAEDIERYTEFFDYPKDAAYISIDRPEEMHKTLLDTAKDRKIELIIVTDAEQILGIGDWGTNGVEIVVGKLAVYTAAAGIDPSKVLGIVLDVGTNNEKLLNDPLYLGNRHKRICGDRYYEFVDGFVKTVEELFPDMYLHFEDFGRSNAAVILNSYKGTYAVFNDDIEGTGIVTLAAILGALKISKEKLTDQKYLCFGAGSAGCGIAKRVYEEMIEQGLCKEEARKRFYLVDKQGLLFEDDEDLTPEQKLFARDRSEFTDELKDLRSAVKAIHPTIMVGTSTCYGAFEEDIVKEMASHTERPIIFPLSNPTKLSEATASDLIKWTDGRVLTARGVPSDPVEHNGVFYEIGQANNALVYPGLGLGVISANARLLTDGMISAAAHSLEGLIDPDDPGVAVLPPVSRLTEFSEKVAVAVVEETVKEGLNRAEITDSKEAVRMHKWYPKY